MADTVRIDKWLWAIRLFKTRSQAAEACKGGKVKIDGNKVKPSREIKAGDLIEVQHHYIKRILKVLKPAHNRVAAKLVPELMEEHTPAEEFEKLEMMRQLNMERRDRGSGRPTKKERRMIEKLKGK